MNKYYPAQYQQDIYLIKSIFSYKKNGVFVELGGYDGYTFSNTYALEKLFDWTGLLIEPVYNNYLKCLEHGRKALNLAVGCKNDILSFPINYEYESNKNYVYDNIIYKGVSSEERKSIHCKTLTDILKINKMPKNIDLLVIDTDGEELNVLKGINFNEYNIYCIMIELNISYDIKNNQYKRASFYNDCNKLLIQNGYKKIHEIYTDCIYIKS